MPDSPNRKLRIQGLERREMTMILRYEEHDTKHYCMFCQSRTPLFISRGHAFALIYGNSVDVAIMSLPINIQCRECGTVFSVLTQNQ